MEAIDSGRYSIVDKSSMISFRHLRRNLNRDFLQGPNGQTILLNIKVFADLEEPVRNRIKDELIDWMIQQQGEDLNEEATTDKTLELAAIAEEELGYVQEVDELATGTNSDINGQIEEDPENRPTVPEAPGSIRERSDSNH